MANVTKGVFTFIWTIDSTQLLILKSARAIESPIANDDKVQGNKWSLKMSRRSLLSDHINIYLERYNLDEAVKDIPDVESETLQSFLEFLYTDTITNTDYEKILKLLLVADKYQVDNLTERCSQILIIKLSAENICEIVSFADMFNQPNVKLFAISFIKANKKEIMSLVWSEWMEKNTKLENEILSKMMIY
ncbi:uncharacterized protein [Parasteatoda tepidariorum]|uniref:uncharacterized protein n=1 Tax=Parasteatoda tepidariorum TaxID=114398 RepID=UPI0039BC32BD